MRTSFIGTFVGCTALLLLGCTTPPPTYKNKAPAVSDADLSFESDFELHTHFSVNTERSSAACGRFETVGYLLKVDSILIYDKANKEINIRVPAERPIGMAGYHFFSDPTYRANCYPGGRFFIPEAQSTYVVKMNRVVESRERSGVERAICFITIDKVEADGRRIPARYVDPPECPKQTSP